MTASIRIDLTTSPTPGARLLVDELEGWLSRFYIREQRHGLALDAIFQPQTRCFQWKRR